MLWADSNDAVAVAKDCQNLLEMEGYALKSIGGGVEAQAR
jgi:hypothetical protein